MASGAISLCINEFFKVGGSIYLPGQTIFSYTNWFPKLLIFNIESCLKISDNLFFNEKIDFFKSFTLPSFILNFSFNSVILITQVISHT